MFGLRLAGFTRVRGSELDVYKGSWLRVQGSGFRAQCSGLRVQGSGLRAQGSGLRADADPGGFFTVWKVRAHRYLDLWEKSADKLQNHDDDAGRGSLLCQLDESSAEDDTRDAWVLPHGEGRDVQGSHRFSCMAASQRS